MGYQYRSGSQKKSGTTSSIKTFGVPQPKPPKNSVMSPFGEPLSEGVLRMVEEAKQTGESDPKGALTPLALAMGVGFKSLVWVWYSLTDMSDESKMTLMSQMGGELNRVQWGLVFNVSRPQVNRLEKSAHLSGQDWGRPKKDTRRWTEEEDEFLRSNTGVMSLRDLAKALGRTPIAVGNRLSMLKKMPKPLPEGGSRFVRENYGVLSVSEMAESLSVDEKDVAFETRLIRASREGKNYSRRTGLTSIGYWGS